MFCYYVKLGEKRVELVQLMHKFVLVCFRSVWVHLSMFHYNTDLGAKWVELAQLMHKFVP